MLTERTYEIEFHREQVPQPIICELARLCRDIMFNIDHLSVSRHEALMRVSVVGEPESLGRADDYLRGTGARVKQIAATPFTGDIPNVPARTLSMPSTESQIHKKLWLTIVGPLRRYPLFWVLSRRYDLTFKILQSTVGDPVSIICLTMYGLATEIEGAVRFLREQGVDVEFGEVAALA